jgi:hypothetical protein
MMTVLTNVSTNLKNGHTAMTLTVTRTATSEGKTHALPLTTIEADTNTTLPINTETTDNIETDLEAMIVTGMKGGITEKIGTSKMIVTGKAIGIMRSTGIEMRRNIRATEESDLVRGENTKKTGGRITEILNSKKTFVTIKNQTATQRNQSDTSKSQIATPKMTAMDLTDTRSIPE